ncbi:apolipoprotein C-IV [Sebastes fasciatus]|uniref:apolipoprotein C-IV n=1 Tax=Sebastes fasciatus TaxID=394691 RepID=UPI003D9E4D9B
MHMNAAVFGVILLMQACGPLLAQTLAPLQPDSPGMLQRLAEKTREVKAKVQDLGEPVLGYIGAYYEDHIQPVTEIYFEWAANVKSFVWEKIQTTIDNYMPLRATNPTDQPPQN